MEQHDHLPELAREIVDLIGFDGMMRLVNHFGGTTIRVPGRGDLKKVLNQDEYKAFVHHFRNLKLAIPRLYAQQKQLEIAETNRLRKVEKLTVAQAARKLQVTERTIYNHAAKSQNDDQQNELF